MGIDSVARLRGLVGEQRESDWLQIDQPLIDGFAEATGDRQPIHVDAQEAAASMFGGTVAHGFLLLSLLPRLRATIEDYGELARAATVVNYGIERLRFVAPVRSGARVRATFDCLAIEQRGNAQWQQTLDVAMAVEGSMKPALVVRWLLLYVFDGIGDADAHLSRTD